MDCCFYCKLPIGLNEYLGVKYWVHKGTGLPICANGKDYATLQESEPLKSKKEADEKTQATERKTGASTKA